MFLISLLYHFDIFLFFYKLLVLFHRDLQDRVEALHRIMHEVLVLLVALRCVVALVPPLPDLSDFVLFVLGHPFVLSPLLLVNFVKYPARIVRFVALQKKPLNNVWETYVNDAFEKVVNQILAFVPKLPCSDP